MAPINLAVFDITCKQIERIIRKLFCLVTKEIKQKNIDYLDIFTIMLYTQLKASTKLRKLFIKLFRIFHLFVVLFCFTELRQWIYKQISCVFYSKRLSEILFIFLSTNVCIMIFFQRVFGSLTVLIDLNCIKLTEYARFYSIQEKNKYHTLKYKSLFSDTHTSATIPLYETPLRNGFLA